MLFSLLTDALVESLAFLDLPEDQIVPFLPVAVEGEQCLALVLPLDLRVPPGQPVPQPAKSFRYPRRARSGLGVPALLLHLLERLALGPLALDRLFVLEAQRGRAQLLFALDILDVDLEHPRHAAADLFLGLRGGRELAQIAEPLAHLLCLDAGIADDGIGLAPVVNSNVAATVAAGEDMAA